MPTPEIKLRLQDFVARLQAYYNTEIPARYNRMTPDLIGIEMGQKFARITTTHRSERDGVVVDGQKLVYCFVDLSNGDILKAAGWKAPAKGKRGSIFNDDCDVGNDKPCNMHGGGLYKVR
jgi:hypothetical protein